jgi:hypothetical protein
MPQNNGQLELPFVEEIPIKIELNSILLEGNLQYNPMFNDRECHFILIHNIEDAFRVVVKGNLAKVCLEYLTAGRGVRVVGKFKQDYDKTNYILAEHVEFKPIRNT